MRVVGLMSGTSADGTDAAIVEIEGPPARPRLELLHHRESPHPSDLREAIFAACDPARSHSRLVCRLNFALGRRFAAAALEAIESAGMTPDQIDLIGSHGQTIWHEVDEISGITDSTLQIGAPAVIAAETGITTIADFRPADVAAGGQGAPLTSFADAALFRHETAFRAVQNIGGIGNVTLLPPRRSDRPVTAFDTGPGNMLIDDAAGRIAGLPFDRDGALAARGRVREGLLMELMHHPFIAQAPPKSTGRETFGAAFADSVWARWKGQIPSEDLIATLTAFTAASIADAYTRFAPAPIDEVYVGGGGALNPVLMRMLAERLAPARVYDHDALKIPAKAKESVAFALLAYATWHNHPGAVPSCTGAERAAILGAISPGRNYGALLGDIRH